MAQNYTKTEIESYTSEELIGILIRENIYSMKKGAWTKKQVKVVAWIIEVLNKRHDFDKDALEKAVYQD